MRLLFAILFFVLLGTLLFLNYYPSLPEMKVKIKDEWFRLDYIGHLGYYALLSASFLLWRIGWRNKVPLRLMIWTMLGGVVFSILTECTQSAIPSRSYNPFDMIYNCFGVITGVIFIWLIRKKDM